MLFIGVDFTVSIEREEGKYKGGEEREIMRNFKDKIINNEEKDCQNWKIEGEKQKIVTTGKMKKKVDLYQRKRNVYSRLCGHKLKRRKDSTENDNRRKSGIGPPTFRSECKRESTERKKKNERIIQK